MVSMLFRRNAPRKQAALHGVRKQTPLTTGDADLTTPILGKLVDLESEVANDGFHRKGRVQEHLHGQDGDDNSAGV